VGFLKTTFTLLGIAGGSYVGISSALAAGLTKTARVRPEDTPEAVGLNFSDVSFTSRGGDARLSGWIIPAENGTQTGQSSSNTPDQAPDQSLDKTPGHTTARGISWIIMLHGDGTNRSDPKTGMLGIAQALNSRGFGVFMFDLRGRGDSPATMSSSGYFERLDLQGASDYLVSKGADRSRIGVLGFSLGGAVALMAGSNPNNFGAVVSDSSFADYSLVLRSSMSGFKRPLTLWIPGMEFMARSVYGIDIREISPARAIARSDTPVLVIHGEDDTVIPVEHARLLGRAIGASFDEIEDGEETVWIVPGAGHTGAFRTQPKTYIERLVKFYEAHLSTPHSSHLQPQGLSDTSENPD
jgi:pimeloyl-ACP methyl ester carboxylesterase